MEHELNLFVSYSIMFYERSIVWKPCLDGHRSISWRLLLSVCLILAHKGHPACAVGSACFPDVLQIFVEMGFREAFTMHMAMDMTCFGL